MSNVDKRDKDAENFYEIYVDGSFISGETGYGAVILKNNLVLTEIFGKVNQIEVAGTRQVAGELKAVIEAINICILYDIEEISIYYDYKGIECWATGTWKTNLEVTRNYAKFIRGCGINIKWIKVDAHTGNVWNERADELAKKGAQSC